MIKKAKKLLTIVTIQNTSKMMHDKCQLN